MSFRDLRGFLDFLEKKGELVRVGEKVSPVLEITEIHRRLIRSAGPAVVFENVVNEDGSSGIPVVANLFGTMERISYGLGIESCGLRDIGRLLAFLRMPTPPESFRDLLGMFPILRNVVSARTTVVKKAKCQEMVITGDDVDLRKFPIQTCWPGDVAPLITWPIVVTHGPTRTREDNFNLGIYRLQVVSENTAIMRWLRHRGGAQQYFRWKKEGKGDFPVAVVLGTDPATTIAAVTPVPETLSEYQFAGILRKRPTELVNCITVPLRVPANAEIVLEGYVSASELLDEGPYGDHTGYYNSVEKFPKFVIKAITMRNSPMYHSTFTGRPPDECSVLGEALNEIIIPMMISQYPEIVDFWLPPEGCSYRVAIVSIKKAYPGHARRIVMGVLSFLRQFMYVKFVIVVDDDICVRDWKDVIWAISTRMDPSRDMMYIEDAPIDYLDFASSETGLGSKVGFDATNKIYPETKREWGVKIEMSKEIIDKVTSRWGQYGFEEKSQ
ncbi:UbiD family decarboxylase [Anaplasma phagocytophilum]|uniref:3-octaprenyl-4-hydroxybenzoate carboxy-lyase n=1 Tax=Anaplasma phagocytophilum str. CRT38 TaxID=1269275 RepID=S6G8Q7_ANAPH|nr:UbiD family decarboxylase [Anaplasma phagocytophilum]EOA62788.1 3-octaprenyl-4-hydroxybenzoate carboxy-lyase [Anaplasma phagocytophilum str. CRT38]